MNKIFGFAALLLSLMSITVWAASSTDSSVPESAQSSGYLSIRVDRVVVDTAGARGGLGDTGGLNRRPGAGYRSAVGGQRRA